MGHAIEEMPVDVSNSILTKWPDRNIGEAKDLYTGDESTEPSQADVLWLELEKKGDIYTPRQGHGMDSDGKNFVFVFGGDSMNFYMTEKYLNDLYMLDLVSGLWKCLHPAIQDPGPDDGIPAPKEGASLLYFKKRLYLFGGSNSSGTMNDLWVYQIKNNSWEIKKCCGRIPPPRSHHSAIIWEEGLYVYGGCEDEIPGTVYMFDLRSKEWSIKGPVSNDGKIVDTPVPRNRWKHTGTLLGSRMMIFGGEIMDTSTSCNETWMFDLHTQEWTLCEIEGSSILPSPRVEHAATAVDENTFVIHGGRKSTNVLGGQSGDAWLLNLEFLPLEWKKISASLVPFCQAARWGHKLVLARDPGVDQDIRSLLVTGGATICALPLH